MDDIFYMSSKNVSIKDINEIAKRMNVKNIFMSETFLYFNRENIVCSIGFISKVLFLGMFQNCIRLFL